MSNNQFSCQFSGYSKRQTVLNRLDFFCRSIQAISAKKPLEILDIGCGNGISLLLAKFALNSLGDTPDHRLTGVEYNFSRLRVASTKFGNALGGEFDFVRGDGEKLPFADKTFDLVIANQVIEHLESPEGLLTSIGRLLANDGKLILTTPNEGCLMGWIRNHIFHRQILKQEHHQQYFTERTLKRMLRDQGFQVNLFSTQGFFYPTLSLNRSMTRTRFRPYFSGVLGEIAPHFAADLMVLAERK